jgi:hypothetical protein
VNEFRILVCGGRDYANWPAFDATMWHVAVHYGATEIIHGAARGADRMADAWARMVGLRINPFPADWNRYGKSAGPVRNQQMLLEGRPHLVVAFPGGRGTADMVRQAQAAGVPVFIVSA